jgi:hypothetical protein
MLGRLGRRLWPLLTIGGLLAAVAVLSVLSRPGFHSVPVPPSVRQKFARPIPTLSPTSGRPPGTGQPTAQVRHSTSTLVTIAGWVCAGIAAIIIGFLIWYLIKTWLESSSERRAAQAAADGPKLTRRQAVLAAVDAGISELARADGDPRAAIIACWVRLEEVAEAAGTSRAPGDTPSDLVARLLGDHQVSQAVLTSLASLYRTARYSTTWIEASMRDDALAAFEHLRAELVQSRSGLLAEQPEYEAAMAGGSVVGSADPGMQPRRPSPRRGRS